jgi:RsiW-degrading membrane proteinase PrsW (M82 family)
VAAASVALLPVIAFLAALELCDSFKLVPRPALVRALALGALAAGAAWVVHGWSLSATGLDQTTFSHDVAPVTEETLKAICVVGMLRRRHAGFLVDAAIMGFAIGAGFALIENVEYLAHLADRRLLFWLVRGVGTAILHASTTAIVAVGTKALSDRYPRRAAWAWAPPLFVAIALHAVYNRALISALLSATICLVVLPIVMLVVFDRSERMTREWVSDGLDLDVELLHLTRSAVFGDTRLGRYLVELRERFPGLIVADMFCLLQVDLELAIRAKGLLLARDAGLDVPVDQELRDLIAERQFLRKTIGPTGLRVLRPLQVSNDRDDWNDDLLRQTQLR